MLRSQKNNVAAKRRRKRKAKLQRPQESYTDSEAVVQLIGKKADWLRLGTDIYKVIENEGLARLTRVREMIAANAGLPMPPIRVVPFGWMNPQETSVVFGIVNIICMKSYFQWGVIFPASTLVIVDDDNILRRILSHEFAHCLWYINKIVQEEKNDEWVSVKPTSYLSTKERYDEQQKIDKEQLVNPNDWFGEWDVKHFIPEGGGFFNKETTLFAERWIKQGLPVQTAELKCDFQGTISFPDEIEEHIHKLHSIN